MIAFMIKKILSPFLLPLSVALLAGGLGLYLLWFTRRQKMGKVLVTVAFVIVLLGASGFTAARILVPLENLYQPLLMTGGADARSADELTAVRWIVVLGGGHASDPRLPVINQLSGDTLCRVTEALRIHRQLPRAGIIFSGGKVFDGKSEAEVMAAAAVSLGLPDGGFALEEISKDTEEQAQNIKGMVGEETFVLVTSAYHMPRSVLTFRKAGLVPIPAPAGYLVKEGSGRWADPSEYFPSSRWLEQSEKACHEYLGTFYGRVRDRL